MFDPKIELKDYEYILPEDRIAKFPLEKRDHSNLLHYREGKISHHHFYDLPDFLESNSLLVYNNTKVIPARLIFQRETGARIEIFLLQPIAPSTVIPEIMLSTKDVAWEVMIGNAKKWKDGEVLKGQVNYQGELLVLEARLENREKQLVSFHWESDEIPFVSIVEASGEVPLPPYLNRKPVAEDKSRYQTVYSKKEGAVAAPTAGLHFTDEVFESLRKKGIKEAELTLHVSAGTFQPIKVANVTEHAMHSEQIHIQRETIEQLLDQEGKTIAVGTTSVRSLESLYWFGVKILEENTPEFFIEKLFPYKKRTQLPTKKQALQAVLDRMDQEKSTEIMGSTEIFIFPGYQFQMIEGLITNFHQPGSTLILLIAAILGEDWKKVYEEALGNGYRFLSYGDSSLLWI
ncbi:S-adenosylmethionine:tRNA ribosyltransferase-isomerase [Algoriphagus hitonicola]|uniref:S-adenosylmethionine:tRNA ribosyltransferase-isomerase n=1 Tax=Algoriphagus hitonicola TaxID=435880 RepID=A0A1I2XDI7_9BACT|nr:S-adenosylmethionine:tRNA ribosyltransferase-isomerase [Algoriphagus hitonicola]SFH11568.1 S-adenosylmethionine:tRNA ribosyltransferase-isomerase [Algoriphagus hitonicola]